MFDTIKHLETENKELRRMIAEHTQIIADIAAAFVAVKSIAKTIEKTVGKHEIEVMEREWDLVRNGKGK